MTTKRTINAALLGKELIVSTSRSSGPGGQNVNKVNTKVTLKFNVPESAVLTEGEKEIILNKLSSRMTTGGALVITAQDKRSQLENKEEAIRKFENLIEKAFRKKKARKATKPSKGSVEDRIKEKKQLSEKKKWRQKF